MQAKMDAAGRPSKKPRSSSTKSASARRWSNFAAFSRPTPKTRTRTISWVSPSSRSGKPKRRATPTWLACVCPRYLGARVALSHVLRGLGDVRGAIREGMIALSQVPGDPDALHAIALAQHARGDDAAARKYLEAFLDTNPEFEVAVEARGLLASLGGGPQPTEDDDAEDD